MIKHITRLLVVLAASAAVFASCKPEEVSSDSWTCSMTISSTEPDEGEWTVIRGGSTLTLEIRSNHSTVTVKDYSIPYSFNGSGYDALKRNADLTFSNGVARVTLPDLVVNSAGKGEVSVTLYDSTSGLTRTLSQKFLAYKSLDALCVFIGSEGENISPSSPFSITDGDDVRFRIYTNQSSLTLKEFSGWEQFNGFAEDSRSTLKVGTAYAFTPVNDKITEENGGLMYRDFVFRSVRVSESDEDSASNPKSLTMVFRDERNSSEFRFVLSYVRMAQFRFDAHLSSNLYSFEASNGRDIVEFDQRVYLQVTSNQDALVFRNISSSPMVMGEMAGAVTWFDKFSYKNTENLSTYEFNLINGKYIFEGVVLDNSNLPAGQTTLNQFNGGITFEVAPKNNTSKWKYVSISYTARASIAVGPKSFIVQNTTLEKGDGSGTSPISDTGEQYLNQGDILSMEILTDPAYAEGRFVMSSKNSTGKVLFSSDKKTWSESFTSPKKLRTDTAPVKVYVKGMNKGGKVNLNIVSEEADAEGKLASWTRSLYVRHRVFLGIHGLFYDCLVNYDASKNQRYGWFGLPCPSDITEYELLGVVANTANNSNPLSGTSYTPGFYADLYSYESINALEEDGLMAGSGPGSINQEFKLNRLTGLNSLCGKSVNIEFSLSTKVKTFTTANDSAYPKNMYGFTIDKTLYGSTEGAKLNGVDLLALIRYYNIFSQSTAGNSFKTYDQGMTLPMERYVIGDSGSVRLNDSFVKNIRRGADAGYCLSLFGTLSLYQIGNLTEVETNIVSITNVPDEIEIRYIVYGYECGNGNGLSKILPNGSFTLPNSKQSYVSEGHEFFWKDTWTQAPIIRANDIIK